MLPPGCQPGLGYLLALLAAVTAFQAPAATAEDVRLVNGTSNTGRLEVYHDGEWGTVCDDGFSDAEATVACRQLGLGSAGAAIPGALFGPGTGRIWLDQVQCRGWESELEDCDARPWGNHDCSHWEDVGVSCSGIRLVGGPTPRSGRLEYYYEGEWGTVCDDGFSDVEATVACRQAGLGSRGTVETIGAIGPGSGRIWLDDVQCVGWEWSLDQCSHRALGSNNCAHSEDVSISCLDDGPFPSPSPDPSPAPPSPNPSPSPGPVLPHTPTERPYRSGDGKYQVGVSLEIMGPSAADIRSNGNNVQQAVAESISVSSSRVRLTSIGGMSYSGSRRLQGAPVGVDFEVVGCTTLAEAQQVASNVSVAVQSGELYWRMLTWTGLVVNSISDPIFTLFTQETPREKSFPVGPVVGGVVGGVAVIAVLVIAALVVRHKRRQRLAAHQADQKTELQPVPGNIKPQPLFTPSSPSIAAAAYPGPHAPAPPSNTYPPAVVGSTGSFTQPQPLTYGLPSSGGSFTQLSPSPYALPSGGGSFTQPYPVPLWTSPPMATAPPGALV